MIRSDQNRSDKKSESHRNSSCAATVESMTIILSHSGICDTLVSFWNFFSASMSVVWKFVFQEKHVLIPDDQQMLRYEEARIECFRRIVEDPYPQTGSTPILSLQWHFYNVMWSNVLSSIPLFVLSYIPLFVLSYIVLFVCLPITILAYLSILLSFCLYESLPPPFALPPCIHPSLSLHPYLCLSVCLLTAYLCVSLSVHTHFFPSHSTLATMVAVRGRSLMPDAYILVAAIVDIFVCL